MWFEPPPVAPDWSEAEKYLCKADRRLAKVIKRVGPCTLVSRGDPFVALCQSIYSQQISTAIATVLFGRFRKLFPRQRVTPAGVLKLFDATSQEELKQVGLSRQKHAYIRDLAEHFVQKKIPVKKLPTMPDEQVIETLTQVNGIGRWTAEMFLIFVLNRPDVWPVDDLGLQDGLRQVLELPDRPTKKQSQPLGDRFAPWRSIATWYLWRRNG